MFAFYPFQNKKLNCKITGDNEARPVNIVFYFFQRSQNFRNLDDIIFLINNKY